MDAASSSSKPEDMHDLVWMNNNLKMDIVADVATLKKTLEEGRVARLVEKSEEMKSVFVELGLVSFDDDENRRSVSLDFSVGGPSLIPTPPPPVQSLLRGRSKYGH